MPLPSNKSPVPEIFFFPVSQDDVIVEVSTSSLDDSSRSSSLAPPQGDSPTFSHNRLTDVDCPIFSPTIPPVKGAPFSNRGTSSGPATPSLQQLTLQTPVKSIAASAVNDSPRFPEKGSTPRRRFMRASGSPPSRPRGRSEREELMRSVEKTPTRGKRPTVDSTTPKASHRRVLFERGPQEPSTSKTSTGQVYDSEDEEPKKKTPRKPH